MNRVSNPVTEDGKRNRRKERFIEDLFKKDIMETRQRNVCNDTSGVCRHKVRLTDVMKLGICSMFICSSAGQLKWSVLMANFQYHGISPMPNQLRQLEQTKVTCFPANVNKRHTTSNIPICLISGRNAAWKLPRNPSFHVIDLELFMAAQCTFLFTIEFIDTE